VNSRAQVLFRGLPGAGTLPAGPDVATGEAGDASTGTQVRFHVQVVEGAVIAARFQAYGCPHTLAVCAHLAGAAVGRIAAQGVGSGPQQWAHEFEVPTEKLGRLLIVEDALAAALRNAANLSVK
jgi:NifU-like protein involved in Fe-S cluster formation